MNFSLTEEQKLIQETSRDIAQKILLPTAIERDIEGRFPKDEINQLASLGYLGMMVDQCYGGGGLDTLSYVLAVEEISKIDASVSVIISVNNSLVCWGLNKYGSEYQKKKYLTPLAKGQKIGAFCLSEPDSGSDATSQKTTAIDKGDYYLLNGIKNWITNGNSASTYIVVAQSNVEKKHKGINAFIVEREMEGLEIGKKEDKLGIRSSDTHSIIFNDVKVPKQNRIGEDGFGFTFAMKTLNGGRIGIAAQSLGIASGAFEIARKYATQRRTFGKPIIKHQAISFKLAEMYTQIEASRNLVYKAAWKKDLGLDYSIISSQAKYFASDVAMRTTTEAVQILGGNGYVKEYHVERLMRDAKITQIYEGSNEIQKIIIGRSLH